MADIDLFVVAGTHMAACGPLRDQVDGARDVLADLGVHLPDSCNGRPANWHNLAWELAGDGRHDPGRGTLGDAVDEARAAGAHTLLLVSEEFEHPLRDPARVADLVALGDELGGHTTVALSFRDLHEYLDLVFAFRAVNGAHDTWFEDFVADPRPPEQFDYAQVVGALVDDPAVTVHVSTVEELVAGGGLVHLLGHVGIEVPGEDLPDLSAEQAPDALDVGVALLAGRLAESRNTWLAAHRNRQALRAVVAEVGDTGPSLGPYWGWTEELVAHHAADHRRQHDLLRDRIGVDLPPSVPREPNRLVLRDLAPDHLAAVLGLVDRVVGHREL